MNDAEKLLTAKELKEAFNSKGVVYSLNYFYELIKACPHTTRGKYIAFHAAYTWWESNKNWRPFGKIKPPTIMTW